jgi:hypothetical protein
MSEAPKKHYYAPLDYTPCQQDEKQQATSRVRVRGLEARARKHAPETMSKENGNQ